MSDAPPIDTVEPGDDYYHVRFRDPDAFDTIRTPDWADEPAGSVCPGSDVRTGHEKRGDDWEIQSVLVPIDAVADSDDAAATAEQIVTKIEE